MRILIVVFALTLTPQTAELLGYLGNTPSKLTPREAASYVDLHKIAPPHEWPEVSPTTKLRAKKAVNWPGNLGEQYSLEGNVSTKGLTWAQKVGREPSR